MKRLLFTLAGIITFAGLSAQCSVIEMPLVQRVNASSLIVEGKVTEQYSYWNSNHTMIYTANKIELFKIFKGSVATEYIEIITEGGTVGLDRITVEPNLVLNIGEEGIFTCIPLTRVKNNVSSLNGLPQFEAYASLQGFVKYGVHENTASDVFHTYSDVAAQVHAVCGTYTEVKTRPTNANQRNGNEELLAGPDPQSFSPGTLNAGTGDVLEIFGEGFGASQGTGGVLFPNADDGGATFIEPLASQYIVWQDDYIKLEVPQNAGTGTFEVRDGLGNTNPAPGPLTITFAHLNVDFDPGPGTIAYETDHVDDNGSGGYTWRMNTGFDGNAPARASFMRAFDTWRCGTLVNWSIGATTSINDAVSDGTNIICFDNTAPLSANILGVCYSYWSGCASGPTIIWYVNELDIIFDEGSNISPRTWEYGTALPTTNEYDFETVAVHELGHGHQLGHVIEPGAIMHYSISNGTANRSLDPNDLAGGQYVQAKSIVANVCGPGAMSNTSCGSPPVAAFIANDVTVCVGQTVNFTDQSTGTPTQWLWSFTGGSPSSSTLQNPSVFYGTPGSYAVSLTATNANGSDNETINGYITVSANPTVGFTSNPVVLTVCPGTMITLNGTGAVSYNWSGGVTNGVPFAATVSDVYTVFGTDANGCIGNANATVTVMPSPTITVTRTPSNGIVCSGGQATLAGNGAVSYSWTGGVTDGVPFTPPSTSSYTVTGTDGNGCTGTAVTSITVQSCGTTTVPCGLVVTNKANSASAVNVVGATQYRFTFYDNVTLAQVCQHTQTSRTLAFTSVPVCYNRTYRWTVAVNTGSGFGAESSINCTITFGVPSTTVGCGVSFNGFSGYTTCPARAGIVNYVFRFYDNVTLALVTTRTQPSNYLYFNQVTGLNYGTTYRWTVQCEYPVCGGGSAFGAESNINCTITFNGLSTTVPCNKTYSLSNVNSYTTATPVSGASGYRFRFYQSAVLMAERIQSSNYIYFTNVTPALSAGVYQWTVEVLYNSGSGPVYGNPSNPCNVTFIGSPPSMALHNSSTDRVGSDGSSDVPVSIALLMYPNPLEDGQTPTVVITGANQQDAIVSVMDLSGRVITTQMVYCEGDEFTTQLSDFPDLVAGMYIMQVQVGDQVKSQKFIAE